MNFLQLTREIDPIFSQTIFNIGGFKINNSTVFCILIAVIVIAVCFFIVRRFSTVPGKSQNVIEMLYEGMENLLVGLTGSKKETQFLISIIGALFIFIGASNLMGMIPGLTSITWDGKPLFRAPTTDFNTTFGLAVGAMLAIQFASVRDYGLLGYLNRFFSFKDIYLGFKQGISKGFLSIVDFYINLFNIIGEIAKVISLSFRLFGNMYASMILMTVFLGISAYILPSFLVATGILFALVQSVVFGSLVAIYYVLSVKQK